MPDTIEIEQNALTPGQVPETDWGLQSSIYPDSEPGDEIEISSADLSQLTGGENIIVYGAPGTGKSYYVEHKLCGDTQSESIFRTVFHRDYTNTDFIGSYRPTINKKDGGSVTYAFVPGPFARALVRAYSFPEVKVCLIIEEINRGNAAAIFGELFQLLDRSPSGQSEYGISPEFSFFEYLDESVIRSGQDLQSLLEPNKILLPSNFFIYATMNSADQGVLPIDTAFKRRWRFEYLPVGFESDEEAGNWTVDYRAKKIRWRDLCEAINNVLRDKGVPEDRLVGQRFFKEEELSDPSVVGSKLLLYLWDDVLRHGDRRKWIFDTAKFKDFGSLLRGFVQGDPVFTDVVNDRI
jgi:MoxR-like ATPase